MLEAFLTQAFQRGVIPICCGGASLCFAFYALKVERGARCASVTESFVRRLYEILLIAHVERLI